MTDLFVQIDTETTGLNPHTTDLLLEIQVFASEPVYPYKRLDDGFHAIIKHDRETAYNTARPFVQEMHAKTGLWDKLENGTPLEEVDKQLRDYLQKHMDIHEGRVVGNSVRLDLNAIAKHLPRTYEWLSYRVIDITSIAKWAQLEFGILPYAKEIAHTALEDIDESMAELRHIRDSIAGSAPINMQEAIDAATDVLRRNSEEDPHDLATRYIAVGMSMLRLLEQGAQDD